MHFFYVSRDRDIVREEKRREEKRREKTRREEKRREKRERERESEQTWQVRKGQPNTPGGCSVWKDDRGSTTRAAARRSSYACIDSSIGAKRSRAPLAWLSLPALATGVMDRQQWSVFCQLPALCL